MKTDSALALLAALDHVPRLSLSEAADLTGLSRTALHTAADTLLDHGLLQEGYGTCATTRRPAVHYTHGTKPTVTVLDMTAALPQVNLFDGSLSSTAAAHIAYDEALPADDNLRLLCHRAERLIRALQARLQASPITVLLIPHAGLPTHPGRPTSPASYPDATIYAILGAPPAAVLTTPDAVAHALRSHPATAEARSVLYISLRAAPCALFLTRASAAENATLGRLPAPLTPLPAFYPFAATLENHLRGTSGTAPVTILVDRLHTLLRFCHPDVLFLDLPMPFPASALRLPPDTTLIIADPHARVSVPQMGAARHGRHLCHEQMLARVFGSSS